MIKLIGTILVLNATLAVGQEAPKQDFGSKGAPPNAIDYSVSHDTLTLVSSWSALYYPFGTFKNYEHLKSYYPEICSKKDGFYYLKDGSSYAKLFRDDLTESVGLIYAEIHNSKIRTIDGIVIGMNKQDVLGKFFKTLPDSLAPVNVLKLEFERGQVGIWHHYKFENNILTSICFDTTYQEDKN